MFPMVKYPSFPIDGTKFANIKHDKIIIGFHFLSVLFIHLIFINLAIAFHSLHLPTFLGFKNEVNELSGRAKLALSVIFFIENIAVAC